MKNKAKKTFSRRSMLKACSTALLAVIVAPSLRGATEAYAAMQNDKKILIIYYSRSGNTKFMAALINVFTGGDMFELKTVTPYPEEYRATAKQAKQELESAFLPPLQSNIDNLSDYEVVFIGSPNWWGTMAMPVHTFLKRNDLSGKTVIPFITHEGSGMGNTLKTLKSFCPNSNILEGMAVRGGSVQNSQDDVAQWLQKIGMSKSK